MPESVEWHATAVAACRAHRVRHANHVTPSCRARRAAGPTLHHIGGTCSTERAGGGVSGSCIGAFGRGWGGGTSAGLGSGGTSMGGFFSGGVGAERYDVILLQRFYGANDPRQENRGSLRRNRVGPT